MIATVLFFIFFCVAGFMAVLYINHTQLKENSGDNPINRDRHRHRCGGVR